MTQNYVENEIYQKILSQQWANNKDISVLLGCGKTKASQIRREVEKEILKKGKKIPPNHKVPMALVCELYGIERKENG